jgi:hypothetical protein
MCAIAIHAGAQGRRDVQTGARGTSLAAVYNDTARAIRFVAAETESVALEGEFERFVVSISESSMSPGASICHVSRGMNHTS